MSLRYEYEVLHAADADQDISEEGLPVRECRQRDRRVATRPAGQSPLPPERLQSVQPASKLGLSLWVETQIISASKWPLHGTSRFITGPG